jgi:hypothetical protein
VALVRTEVSEELRVSIIRMTRIGDLRTTLAVPGSQILVILVMKAISSSVTPVLTKPHGVTPQHTAFFIVTAVKTWNPT